MITNLDAKNMIAGLDHRLTHLPNALTRVGIPVPAPLSQGLATARWKLPKTDVEAAESAVINAKTETDFQSAMTDLASARLTADVVESVALRGVADRTRLGAAEDGFRQSYPGLMESVSAAYNAKVPAFRNELENVPDLRGRTVYDLSANDADALRAARDTASYLTDLLGVYQTIAALAGYPGTGSATDVPGAMSLLSIIAVFEYGQALEMAARDVVRYRNGEGLHGPLAPHATAVWHSDHVEMVAPEDAAERLAIARLNWSPNGTDNR